ncbi:MAG: hypothetical protein HY298_06485 [Verrucomicrobia bacterium]|nr:hypothetical protein [Verrucomicrobiota bacterium]
MTASPMAIKPHPVSSSFGRTTEQAIRDTHCPVIGGGRKRAQPDVTIGS